MQGEDGKWFQALDERYLLPIFSNATASRTFHARRQRRADAGHDLEEREEMGEDMPPEPAPGGQVAAVMDESRMERVLHFPFAGSRIHNGLQESAHRSTNVSNKLTTLQRSSMLLL